MKAAAEKEAAEKTSAEAFTPWSAKASLPVVPWGQSYPQRPAGNFLANLGLLIS